MTKKVRFGNASSYRSGAMLLIDRSCQANWQGHRAVKLAVLSHRYVQALYTRDAANLYIRVMTSLFSVFSSVSHSDGKKKRKRKHRIAAAVVRVVVWLILPAKYPIRSAQHTPFSVWSARSTTWDRRSHYASLCEAETPQGVAALWVWLALLATTQKIKKMKSNIYPIYPSWKCHPPITRNPKFRSSCAHQDSSIKQEAQLPPILLL